MQVFFCFLLLFVVSSFAEKKEIRFVPGEYVVKFKTNNKSSIAAISNQLKTSKGVHVKSVMPSLGISVVKIDDQKINLESLKNNSNIERVEPNYIYTNNYAFGIRSNDPSLSKLWGMINTGQPDSSGQAGVPGMDINAISAWKIQTGSADTVVAVIDSGVNYKSKDLASNMWVNEAEKNGKKGIDDDGNGYVDDIHGYNFVADNGDPMDDQGHGTHCSGTIGAVGNDKYGIVGVAWKTRIMAIKFLDEEGAGTLENALKSIEYAVKNGAKILSNSWSGGSYSETLKEMIEKSNQSGAIFVAAASNDANDNDVSPTYPASYDVANILAVAAINNRGRLANFSNYGKTKVHIAAPGVNIYSTVLKGYNSWSGTSMAAPHVSGAAVLMASQHPKMTGVQIKEAILNAAKPNKYLRNKVSTNGQLDTYAALMLKNVGPDMDDPYNWPDKMEYQLSTEHPYKPLLKNSWEITVPNANEIAVYFSKLDTEFKYDSLKIYDADGKLVQSFSGENNDSFSETIKGNYVRIVFETDKSVQKYGFDITSVSYR